MAVTDGRATRVAARLIPRLAILATVIAEVVQGDLVYAASCLVALALTLIPAIHARSLEATIPLEIELALLWLMLA